MDRSSPPPYLAELLSLADIQINGTRPFDLKVKNVRFYKALQSKWSLGMGESYMDGDWECDQLDELISRLLRLDIHTKIKGSAKIRYAVNFFRHHLINLQSKRRSFQVGEVHYDKGNDLFEKMLDPLMIYSCAYWEHANTLEQAQVHKLDMICRKLELKKGERLLDIGCGWGGLAYYAATHYGVEVVGVTISKEQQAYAQKVCTGLPVTIMLTDYRSLQGEFDKIVSVGMFEHVGVKNYAIYFDTAHQLLKTEGLFLLHTIGSWMTAKATEPWIEKYIFPNGKIPSILELTKYLDGRFVVEDWHNFGTDYDRTLLCWHHNFVKAWSELSKRYSERFFRMWTCYLLGCAGFFRSRQGFLWQLVLTKRARNSTYRSIRLLANS